MYTKTAGRETDLNKLKITEITQVMFSDHNGIKLKTQVNFLPSSCSFPSLSTMCHPLRPTRLGCPITVR